MEARGIVRFVSEMKQTRLEITEAQHGAANDRNLFVFDESYADNPDRPVLSLSFYNADGRLDTATIPTQTKVTPFFSNLLPEVELRQYVAQCAGVKSVRDLPLLQLLGEDLPGAVVVRAESDGTARSV